MWFLALKHIFTRKSQTLLTFAAIVMGSGGFIVFSAMQLGFKEYMISNLIERDGHIRITPRNETISKESVNGLFYEGANVKWLNTPTGRRSNANLTSAVKWFSKLDSMKDVRSYAPIASETFIVTKGNFSKSVSLTGIDPEKHRNATNLFDYVVEGDLNEVTNGLSLVFAGKRFLEDYGLKKDDTVIVASPDGSLFPMRIIGTFDTGDFRTDGQTLFTSISTVQKMIGKPGYINKIIVKIDDVSKAAETATRWQSGSVDDVESWDQANENFLSMTKTQDTVRDVTTITFIVVVAFGIYNILNMVVNHKQKEIAILRSIGYTENDTVFLFLIQGALIGIAGVAAGEAIAFFFCKYLETLKIPMGRGHMRISWDVMIYVKSFVLVFGSALVASYFPARSAGKLSPIEIIKGTS